MTALSRRGHFFPRALVSALAGLVSIASIEFVALSFVSTPEAAAVTTLTTTSTLKLPTGTNHAQETLTFKITVKSSTSTDHPAGTVKLEAKTYTTTPLCSGTLTPTTGTGTKKKESHYTCKITVAEGTYTTVKAHYTGSLTGTKTYESSTSSTTTFKVTKTTTTITLTKPSLTAGANGKWSVKVSST
ncbi:MAG: hypothetical protein ACREHV_10090, partial [Rhizomicrobium sp.]